MANNQKLSATITIGAALQQSVKRNLDVVGRGLKNVGDEIRTVTARQKELDKELRVLERQGKAVDHLDGEYQELNRTLERLADRQRRLQAVQDGMGRVGGAFGNMAREIGSTARTAGIAVAGIGTAIFGLANGTANAAREVGLFANLSNASTTEFQRMAAGAQSVGIEQDKLADILKDVNDRVGDFLTTGGGPMKDFFEQIGPKVGITADHFRDLSGPEALQLFVSSLEKANLSQQEMTFFMEAMASDATALIPLLRNNGAEMFRMAQAAEQVGAILDEETIAASIKFQQEMTRAGQALTGVRNIIGAELIPVVGQLATEFTTFVRENRPQVEAFAEALAEGTRRAIPVIGQVVTGLGDVAGKVGSVIASVSEMVGGWENFGVILGAIFAGKAIMAVGAFVVTVGQLGAAVLALVAPGALPAVAVAIKAIGLALVANPIGATITAIAVGATLIVANWGTVKTALEPIIAWMGESFDWLMEKLRPVIDGLTWLRDKAGGAISAVGDFITTDGPSERRGRNPARRAVGGSFLPGATLVGEMGPELRFESRAGFIATNRQLRGMVDMADRIRGVAARGVQGAAEQIQQSLTIAQGAIVINAAPGMDPRAIADTVLGELQRRQRGALYDGGAI